MHKVLDIIESVCYYRGMVNRKELHEMEYRNKLVTQRAERIRRQKKIERITGLFATVGTIGAILFFIAVLGYVGSNDLEYELMQQGYTQAEARELMK